MFRLTGGHRGKHIETNHTDLNAMMCTVLPLLDPQSPALLGSV